MSQEDAVDRGQEGGYARVSEFLRLLDIKAGDKIVVCFRTKNNDKTVVATFQYHTPDSLLVLVDAQKKRISIRFEDVDSIEKTDNPDMPSPPPLGAAVLPVPKGPPADAIGEVA